MKRDIYKTYLDRDEDRILQVITKKCAKNMGVTLQGNRLTLRATDSEGKLVTMHAVIIELTDEKPEPIEEDEA